MMIVMPIVILMKMMNVRAGAIWSTSVDTCPPSLSINPPIYIQIFVFIFIYSLKKNYPTTINANFYLDIRRNLEYLNPIFIYNFKKLFIATMNANLYLNILINLESFIPILTLATIFNKLL